MENNLIYLEEVKTTLEYQLHIAEQKISHLQGQLEEKDQQIREKESKLIELGKQVADKIVLEEMLEEKEQEVFRLEKNIEEIRKENIEKMISEELLHVTDHQLRERQEEPANWQTAPHLRLGEKKPPSFKSEKTMHENNTEISQSKLITKQQLGESQGKRAELQEGEKEGRVTATVQENRNLRDQMSSREQEVINLKGRLTSKDQEVTNLQAQLTDREQEVRDLGSQLTTREQDIKNLHSQLIARERDTRVQLTEREQAITDLQSEVNETRQEITNLRNQLIERERQITVGRDNQEGSHSSRSHNLRPHDWEIRKTEIFLMDEVLGEGASGRVVRGKFRGCNVAVKQIHRALLTYRHIRDSFKREVEFASRSRHPCLLQFIGATIDGAEPMLVTELLDRSLRSLYEERSLIDKEISDISHDVALALNYLHEQKPQPIIHGDISSANVLLWQHGDHWRGKVSDYGTANFVRECSTNDPGAPIYCAPENLLGSRDQTISCKVDVYSFGVLLCEMCIRELPDPQKREQQVRRVTKGVCHALVKMCLQSEPGRRPNMQLVIDEVDGWSNSFRL